MYFSNPPRPDSAPTRTNWKRAFADLLANPKLSIKDRATITSMHAHWNAGRAMTRGRKSYFYLIQERAQKAAEALAEREATGSTEMGLRLAELDSRIDDRASWNAGFVESLINQEAQGRNLSPRQVEILEKIETDYTDDKLAAREAWGANYGPEQVERMRIACAYYGMSGYYSTITREFLGNPEFVPTQEQYNKVVNNKYSQKVMAAHFDEPQFSAGTMVLLRSTARSRVHNEALRRGLPAVVVSTTEPIVSAARGAKRYLVLPVGCAETVLVEERDLKIHR
jgi:hypothetical protein